MFDQIAAAKRWGDEIIIANIVFSVITVSSLACRLWAKTRTKASFGWDDYMVVFAQLIWFAQLATQIYAVRAGFAATESVGPELLDFVFVCLFFVYF
jgi:hypothetical protein